MASVIIKELFIEEFGALINKKYTLSDGLNLISGKNESGKSTLCAFIKYIFYGFSDGKERERHASLKTGIASGAVTLVYEDTLYRIERRDTGRRSTVTVYDEQTKEKLDSWKNEADTPGDYFLGVPQALYSRSLYVSQASGARLDGGSAEAVGNLLISGDEALSLKKAKKSLDLARREIKLKKGQGGRLFECEQRLQALNERKTRGLALKRELEGLTLDIQNEELTVKDLQAELERVRNEFESAKNRKIRTYLDALNEAKLEADKANILIGSLTEQYSHNGFLPSKEYENDLMSAEKELDIYQNQVKSIEEQIKKIRSDLTLTPPAGYEQYCKLGKSESILNDYKLQQGRLSLFSIISLSAAFLAAVAIIALIAAAAGFIQTSKPSLGIMAGITSAVSVLFFALRIKQIKTVKHIMFALEASKDRPVHKVCDECEGYEKKLSSSSHYLYDTLASAQKNLQKAQSRLSALLDKWGRTEVSQAKLECKTFFEQMQALGEKKQRAERNRGINSACLSQYTEKEIENAKNAELPPNSNGQSAFTEEYIHALESRLDEAQKRKNELSLRAAASGSGEIDIERLVFDIESETAKKSDYEEKLRALMLALDTLEAAEREIRTTVSPYLATQAGKTFAEITDGRYPELRLDSEMNLSYISSDSMTVTDSKYLSGGSADLAWLCLRLALHKRLSGSERPPLILDEALVYFDDTRLSSIMHTLADIAKEGTQILLFTAASREKAVSENLPYTEIII